MIYDVNFRPHDDNGDLSHDKGLTRRMASRSGACYGIRKFTNGHNSVQNFSQICHNTIRAYVSLSLKRSFSTILKTPRRLLIKLSTHEDVWDSGGLAQHTLNFKLQPLHCRVKI
jgi:hypothetical protein